METTSLYSLTDSERMLKSYNEKKEELKKAIKENWSNKEDLQDELLLLSEKMELKGIKVK